MSCPTPTTSAFWDRSGTTWPAARRPGGSRGAARRPPGAAGRGRLADPACTWLWRSLREAEAAGLDGGEVLRQAIAARSLAGARDIARVIDSRVRRMIAHSRAAAPGSWAGRVPDMGDPELDRYMADLAARDGRPGPADRRARRPGPPAWAVRALGDVPADPARRAGWEARAAALGAYRELYGYDAQDDAIGPEPGKTSPEARADWHAAFAALGRVEGIDLRGCSDGQLRLRRAMYERETSWAPAFVAEDLRLARLQARTAWENAIRADHEARAAAGPKPPGGIRHWPECGGPWKARRTASPGRSPRHRKPGANGKRSPSQPAGWPSPPTSSSAAATPRPGCDR